MIPETPSIPRQLKPEDRFVTDLKKQLRIYAQEINKLHDSLKIIEEEFDPKDYYTKEEIDGLTYNLEQEVVAFLQYNTIYEFPNLGDENVAYVTISDNSIYRWDKVNKKYYCVGRDWTQIKKIDGGRASG